MGDVPGHGVMNVTADFKVNDVMAIGVNASNVFDHEHRDSFGGDIIGSRALGWVSLA